MTLPTILAVTINGEVPKQAKTNGIAELIERAGTVDLFTNVHAASTGLRIANKVAPHESTVNGPSPWGSSQRCKDGLFIANKPPAANVLVAGIYKLV